MKKSRITNQARKAIYRRDGYQCACCGDNRRLQIHHIWKRSQGGGDEQMNLITLCSVCHALAHGINLCGVELTKADVEQTMIEYMADYYADLGVQWPTGEPLAGFDIEEWEQAYLDEWDRLRPMDIVEAKETGRCWLCKREGCIHREAYRRLPVEVGGLGLCPGEITE